MEGKKNRDSKSEEKEFILDEKSDNSIDTHTINQKNNAIKTKTSNNINKNFDISFEKNKSISENSDKCKSSNLISAIDNNISKKEEKNDQDFDKLEDNFRINLKIDTNNNEKMEKLQIIHKEYLKINNSKTNDIVLMKSSNNNEQLQNNSSKKICMKSSINITNHKVSGVNENVKQNLAFKKFSTKNIDKNVEDNIINEHHINLNLEKKENDINETVFYSINSDTNSKKEKFYDNYNDSFEDDTIDDNFELIQHLLEAKEFDRLKKISLERLEKEIEYRKQKSKVKWEGLRNLEDSFFNQKNDYYRKIIPTNKTLILANVNKSGAYKIIDNDEFLYNFDENHFFDYIYHSAKDKINNLIISNTNVKNEPIEFNDDHLINEK